MPANVQELEFTSAEAGNLKVRDPGERRGLPPATRDRRAPAGLRLRFVVRQEWHGNKRILPTPNRWPLDCFGRDAPPGRPCSADSLASVDGSANRPYHYRWDATRHRKTALFPCHSGQVKFLNFTKPTPPAFIPFPFPTRPTEFPFARILSSPIGKQSHRLRYGEPLMDCGSPATGFTKPALLPAGGETTV